MTFKFRNLTLRLFHSATQIILCYSNSDLVKEAKPKHSNIHLYINKIYDSSLRTVESSWASCFILRSSRFVYQSEGELFWLSVCVTVRSACSKVFG